MLKLACQELCRLMIHKRRVFAVRMRGTVCSHLAGFPLLGACRLVASLGLCSTPAL